MIVIGLSACAETSRLLPTGGLWVLAVSNRDTNQCLADDATLAATVTLPNGTAASPAPVVTRLALGTYQALYTVGTAGRYVARVTTATDAVDFAAYAAATTAGTGMPDADALAAYLHDDASSWTTDEMTDVLAIESAAQRAACRVPAVYPDDLRGALLRRAQRNMAMRLLPLAIPQGDADGGATILPGRDPEVRRLEGPYRKLVMG